MGLQTAILNNCFYRVGQGKGMSLWNQQGQWPENVWEPLLQTNLFIGAENHTASTKLYNPSAVHVILY